MPNLVCCLLGRGLPSFGIISMARELVVFLFDSSELEELWKAFECLTITDCIPRTWHASIYTNVYANRIRVSLKRCQTEDFPIVKLAVPVIIYAKCLWKTKPIKYCIVSVQLNAFKSVTVLWITLVFVLDFDFDSVMSLNHEYFCQQKRLSIHDAKISCGILASVINNRGNEFENGCE